MKRKIAIAENNELLCNFNASNNIFILAVSWVNFGRLLIKTNTANLILREVNNSHPHTRVPSGIMLLKKIEHYIYNSTTPALRANVQSQRNII